MECDQENAVQKFLRSPDLMEKLLPYLDASSALSLAQSRISCLLQHLQRTSVVWNKLVQRTLPGDNKIPDLDNQEYWNRVSESFQEKRVPILSLVTILKMMENAKSHELHLLHVICEKSPPDVNPRWNLGEPISITISCSCHDSHSVSPLGLMLLEEVEAAVGSTLQEVDRVVLPALVHLREPLLSALASKVSRQQQKEAKFVMHSFDLTTKESAEALVVLVQNSGHVGWYRTPAFGFGVIISGNIEAEGWAALAKVPGGVTSITARRTDLMKEGRREDLRILWESGCFWFVDDINNEVFVKKGKEEADERNWMALEHLLDNS